MIDVKGVIELISKEVSGDEAWGYMAEIFNRDRWSSFDGYRKTAEFCADKLWLFGISSQTVPFPADGKTRIEDWITPLCWEPHAWRLEVIDPPLPEGERVVASVEFDPPCGLVMWSDSTPPEGVEGELLALEKGEPEELEGIDLSGKVVLTPSNPARLKPIVARKGGLGIVSYWVKGKGLPDAVQWVNTWSDSPGGWAMHAHHSRLWGIMIPPRRGERLKELVSKGRVRVKALVSTEIYEGELLYAVGLIEGRSDEEVLLTAHINEQGANDNASGAAVLLESARVLHKLISSGELPVPRRSIRLLLMPESYGTIAYVSKNLDAIKNKTFAALNVDGGAGDYESDDSALTVYLDPLCCRSPVDGAVAEIASVFYNEVVRIPEKLRFERYSLAGDNFLCEPMIGVPNPWFEMGDGGEYWHNSEDTPDKVDPRSLRDLTALTASTAYLLASLEVDELAELAGKGRGRLPGEVGRLLEVELPPPDGPGPVRSVVGPLTLDSVPPERWRVVKSSPRWWGPYLAAWWWADGARSVRQIAELVRIELGKAPEGIDEFFEFLEEEGLIRSPFKEEG